MEVVPAILAASREEAEEKMARLAKAGFSGCVQLDAIDGRFAAPACWPYTAKEFPRELPGLGRFTLDADLMVADPEPAAERFAAAGATRLTLHAESARDLGALLAALRRRLGHEKDFVPGLISLGVALSLETPLSLIDPHIDAIDYVQLMGIAHIGRQRQPFDPRVIARARELVEWLAENVLETRVDSA